jgi:Retrotransposon gag protein
LYDWLDKAEQNPDDILPFGTMAWEVLEQDFHQAFINYAEHERAQDEIRKLHMKDKNIDKYIAAFECLSHHVGMDLNNSIALQLFTRGLPRSLADSCIDIKNLDSFEQWTKAAQRYQRNWL